MSNIKIDKLVESILDEVEDNIYPDGMDTYGVTAKCDREYLEKFISNKMEEFMKEENMKYKVQVCKWFDRVNGNTYHNVVIICPDGQILKSGFKYGYGTAYKETAIKTLKENGFEATSKDLDVVYETDVRSQKACKDFRGVLLTDEV